MADNTTDPCGADTPANYNQKLHIGAIFIILVASLLGTALPLLGKRFPSVSPGPFFYTCGKHTGTGVLLALGLVHLLTPAFEAATKGHSHSVIMGKNIEVSVSAYILEFGLTAHSVIIGIAVGVAPGKELKSLIPALAFHQFFEGVALGARLADVGFSGFTEVLLTTVYSTSASIGIGIGIGVHRSYNPNSAKANYIQGTFDAIAAGIILYVAFVQMLAIDFTRDVRRVKGFWRKGTLLVCLWVGAGIMALIGKWL